ncbi:YheU family protein [bacterium]|nr:YheU family protein [bacterium]
MAALIEVPPESLEPETVRALIEAYILQSGTDYGSSEISLPTRVEQVHRQIQRKEVRIVFHAESETCTILTERAWKEALKKEEPL